MASGASKPWLARQPLKVLTTTLTIISLFFRLPFLCLYYLPPAFRQHPTWSYKRALGNQLLRIWFVYASTVEFRFPRSLEPGVEKDRFEKIEPADNVFFQGPLKDKQIKPQETGGTWYPHRFNQNSDLGKKVILHLHGGGFVLSDARDMNCKFCADTLTKATGAMAFFVEYRLSSHPDCRFPAALQDALTAYRHLLGIGFPASRIILSGDSAGANLAVALLRYAAENPDIVPTPSATLLWSPWVDMSMKRQDPSASQNYYTDFIMPQLFDWAIRVYVPSFSDPSDPYFSPVNHPFVTKSPLFINVGSKETLREEGVRFYETMKNLQGNRVQLNEVSGVNHDIILAGNLTGCETEAQEAAEVAHQFLEENAVA